MKDKVINHYCSFFQMPTLVTIEEVPEEPTMAPSPLTNVRALRSNKSPKTYVQSTLFNQKAVKNLTKKDMVKGYWKGKRYIQPYWRTTIKVKHEGGPAHGDIEAVVENGEVDDGFHESVKEAKSLNILFLQELAQGKDLEKK